jgi:predicted membrane protein
LAAQAPRGDESLYFAGIRERRRSAHVCSERGEGKLKTVFFIVVALLLVYSAVKIIPAYVSDYQLSDKMQEQARFAVVNRYTEEQIRDNVFKTVQELEIPAKRDDIKVSANNAMVKISLSYTVPVDLFFYHMDLNFSPSSENKALF